jgi:hypothetical protein
VTSNVESEHGDQGGRSHMPAVAAPSGGGAVRGMGEQFAVNAVNG